MTDQPLFILTEDVDKHPTRYRGMIKELLRLYCERGYTLKRLSDPKITNLTVATLKKHARTHGLSFPDYKPRMAKAKNQRPPGSTEWEWMSYCYRRLYKVGFMLDGGMSMAECARRMDLSNERIRQLSARFDRIRCRFKTPEDALRGYGYVRREQNRLDRIALDLSNRALKDAVIRDNKL